MLEEKNLFEYTTELSHSAFWAWCFSSKDNNAKKLRIKFLHKIGINKVKIKDVKTEIKYKKYRYDICVILNTNKFQCI